MKSFKNFLFINEAKAKEVIAQYPHLSHLDQKHISSYGSHLGKITTPNDDPIKIKSTIEAFDKDKNNLPKDSRDITKYNSLDEIQNAIKPIQQKREYKKDIKILHDDPENNIQIKQINTRQACEKNYGGGKTSWCVAASGQGNLFDQYGESGDKMFTIHHNNNVYGIHEYEDGAIRNEQNNNVTHSMPNEVLKSMAKVPELTQTNLIIGNKHFKPNPKDINNFVNHSNFSTIFNNNAKRLKPEHIDQIINNPNLSGSNLHAVLSNKAVKANHIDKFIDRKNPSVLNAITKNPNTTTEQLSKIANNPTFPKQHMYNLLKHPNAPDELLTDAISTPFNNSFSIEGTNAYGAIENPNAKEHHLLKALDHQDDILTQLAADHKNATENVLIKALDNKDETTRVLAAGHQNRTQKVIDKAKNDPSIRVQNAIKGN